MGVWVLVNARWYKGPADHLISGLTDQDCAMHRGFTDKPVCNPPKDEGILTGVETNSEDGQEVTDQAVSESVGAAARLGVR